MFESGKSGESGESGAQNNAFLHYQYIFDGEKYLENNLEERIKKINRIVNKTTTYSKFVTHFYEDTKLTLYNELNAASKLVVLDLNKKLLPNWNDTIKKLKEIIIKNLSKIKPEEKADVEREKMGIYQCKILFNPITIFLIKCDVSFLCEIAEENSRCQNLSWYNFSSSEKLSSDEKNITKMLGLISIFTLYKTELEKELKIFQQHGHIKTDVKYIKACFSHLCNILLKLDDNILVQKLHPILSNWIEDVKTRYRITILEYIDINSADIYFNELTKFFIAYDLQFAIAFIKKISAEKILDNINKDFTIAYKIANCYQSLEELTKEVANITDISQITLTIEKYAALKQYIDKLKIDQNLFKIDSILNPKLHEIRTIISNNVCNSLKTLKTCSKQDNLNYLYYTYTLYHIDQPTKEIDHKALETLQNTHETLKNSINDLYTYLEKLDKNEENNAEQLENNIKNAFKKLEKTNEDFAKHDWMLACKKSLTIGIRNFKLKFADILINKNPNDLDAIFKDEFAQYLFKDTQIINKLIEFFCGWCDYVHDRNHLQFFHKNMRLTDQFKIPEIKQVCDNALNSNQKITLSVINDIIHYILAQFIQNKIRLLSDTAFVTFANKMAEKPFFHLHTPNIITMFYYAENFSADTAEKLLAQLNCYLPRTLSKNSKSQLPKILGSAAITLLQNNKTNILADYFTKNKCLVKRHKNGIFLLKEFNQTFFQTFFDESLTDEFKKKSISAVINCEYEQPSGMIIDDLKREQIDAKNAANVEEFLKIILNIKSPFNQKEWMTIFEWLNSKEIATKVQNFSRLKYEIYKNFLDSLSKKGKQLDNNILEHMIPAINFIIETKKLEYYKKAFDVLTTILSQNQNIDTNIKNTAVTFIAKYVLLLCKNSEFAEAADILSNKLIFALNLETEIPQKFNKKYKHIKKLVAHIIKNPRKELFFFVESIASEHQNKIYNLWQKNNNLLAAINYFNDTCHNEKAFPNLAGFKEDLVKELFEIILIKNQKVAFSQEFWKLLTEKTKKLFLQKPAIKQQLLEIADALCTINNTNPIKIKCPINYFANAYNFIKYCDNEKKYTQNRDNAINCIKARFLYEGAKSAFSYEIAVLIKELFKKINIDDFDNTVPHLKIKDKNITLTDIKTFPILFERLFVTVVNDNTSLIELIRDMHLKHIAQAHNITNTDTQSLTEQSDPIIKRNLSWPKNAIKAYKMCINSGLTLPNRILIDFATIMELHEKEQQEIALTWFTEIYNELAKIKKFTCPAFQSMIIKFLHSLIHSKHDQTENLFSLIDKFWEEPADGLKAVCTDEFFEQILGQDDFAKILQSIDQKNLKSFEDIKLHNTYKKLYETFLIGKIKVEKLEDMKSHDNYRKPYESYLIENINSQLNNNVEINRISEVELFKKYITVLCENIKDFIMPLRPEQFRTNLPSFKRYEALFNLALKLNDGGKSSNIFTMFSPKKKTSEHQLTLKLIDDAIFSLMKRCFNICRGVAIKVYKKAEQNQSTNCRASFRNAYTFLESIKDSTYLKQSSHKKELKEFLQEYDKPYNPNPDSPSRSDVLMKRLYKK